MPESTNVALLIHFTSRVHEIQFVGIEVVQEHQRFRLAPANADGEGVINRNIRMNSQIQFHLVEVVQLLARGL